MMQNIEEVERQMQESQQIESNSEVESKIKAQENKINSLSTKKSDVDKNL